MRGTHGAVRLGTGLTQKMTDATDKLKILAQFRPRAVLKALTPEAARAVPMGMLLGDMVPVLRYPFRVGRESRVRVVEGQVQRIERQKPDRHAPNNDLYLVDAGGLTQISREHFRIEQMDGDYRVVDRRSDCGIGVGDLRVGGEEAGGMAPLRDGDIIAVGTTLTPYRYRFIVLE